MADKQYSLSFITDDVVWIFDGIEAEKYLYRIGEPNARAEIDGYKMSILFNDELLLDRYDRLFDGKTLKKLIPPADRKYHPLLQKFSNDGRFFFCHDTGILDLQTEKRIEIPFVHNRSSHPEKQPAFYPNFGSIALRDSARFILPAVERLNIPPALLQLWAQVAVRGELGSEGEFVKWDAATWEAKRQELAATPPPFPDFPFPGHVATDKLHWHRAEYHAATTDADKLRLATQLLHLAEATHDKPETARWRAELSKLVPETAPPPRERK